MQGMRLPAALLLSLLPALAFAGEPERYYPDDLGQDGRITLFPAFSPDGQTLYLTQSEGSPIWEYPQRLKRSTRTATGWSAPEPVDLGEPGRVDGASVSPDGRTLYLSWAPARPEADGGATNFDLFALDLTNAEARPEALGAVNTLRAGRVATLRYVNNEGSPSVDAAGRLYFFSERLDQGPGERDLFTAEPDGQGGFLAPTVVPLSTPQREGAPWVTPDGQRLFYAVAGECGGSDIVVSERTAEGWSAPRNLGCTVNGPGEEFGARLSPDGDLLFTSDRAFGDTPEGLLQVWWVEGWDAG